MYKTELIRGTFKDLHCEHNNISSKVWNTMFTALYKVHFYCPLLSSEVKIMPVLEINRRVIVKTFYNIYNPKK